MILTLRVGCLLSFVVTVSRNRLRGDYRRFVLWPENVEYGIESYEDDHAVLISSDGDRLTQSMEAGKADAAQDLDDPMGESKPSAAPSKLSLCLKFNLPKSTYATIFLVRLSCVCCGLSRWRVRVSDVV